MKRIISALAVLGLTSASMAQTTIDWTGADGGAYETGGNWNGGIAPADDLTSNIAQLTGGTVDLSSTQQVAGIDFASGSTLRGIGSIEVGSSGIAVSGDSTISTADLVLNNNTAITLNGTLGISSHITGSGDLSVTAGTATDFSLTGVNHGGTESSPATYTGDITFDGVNVSLGRWGLGGDSSSSLTLANGAKVSALNGTHLYLFNRNIILDGGGVLEQNNNENIYGIGNISGTGGITFTHTNGSDGDKVQLTSIGNTYTGGTTIQNGVDVHITDNTSLGDAAGGITLESGGKLVFLNSTDLDARAITVNSGGGTLGLNGKTVTVDGTLAGAGELTLNGGGIFKITTAENDGFTGGTKITDGSAVEVRNGTVGILGTGTITLDDGKIYGAGGHVNMRDTTSVVLGEGGGTFQNAHSKAFYGLDNAVISGDGQLTLDGGGSTHNSSRIQVGDEANTYTGGTVIQNKANLQLGGDGSLGLAGTKVTIDDARVVSGGVNYGSREIEVTSGGARISLNGQTSVMGGPLTGSGVLTIDNTQRDYNSGAVANQGVLRMTATGTHTGNVTVDGAFLELGANNALGTGTITLDNGSRLKNRDSHTTLDNALIIGAGGGELMAGWNKSLSLDGALSGSGGLTVVADSGTVYLNGDSSAFTGLLSVEDGAKLGGSGTINGGLTVAAGGTLVFSTTDTLTVASGVVSLDSTFGVDDLIDIDSSVADGTYTLIDGDVSASFAAGFENIGLENAFDLGDGKSAYFEEGSLQVTVIPEPATLGLVAAFGGAVMFIRRRFMI
ncbi:hypothetical protein P4B35_06420 [Pontiellaceae bacterium B12227]|nr:hypothetical protein [Pontiellaceae bacterium B12227]